MIIRQLKPQKTSTLDMLTAVHDGRWICTCGKVPLFQIKLMRVVDKLPECHT